MFAGPPGRELVMMLAAGGTTAPADAAFFLPAFLPSPLPMSLLGLIARRFDGTKWEHGRRRRATACSSFPRIELTLLLVSTRDMPSHAVRIAIASAKAGIEDFRVGPVDRHGLIHSANKALDDVSHVFQVGASRSSPKSKFFCDLTRVRLLPPRPRPSFQQPQPANRRRFAVQSLCRRTMCARRAAWRASDPDPATMCAKRSGGLWTSAARSSPSRCHSVQRGRPSLWHDP